MTRLPLELINEQLKINIDKELLMEYIAKNDKYETLYETFVKKSTGLEEITYNNLKEKYEVKTYRDINNERLVRALEMYFNYKNTGDTCKAVLDKLNNGTLKPQIYETKTGNITCKNHTFNHLSNTELAKLLKYEDFIKFDTVVELEEFIIKYFKLFKQFEDKSTYFIRSNTLFLTLELQSYKIAYYNSDKRKDYIDTCSKFTKEIYDLSLEFLADANIVANKQSTFYSKHYDRFVDFRLGLQAQVYEGTPQFTEFYKLINANFMEDETDKANKFNLIKLSYMYNNQTDFE